ncbi:hypothetical protein HCU40_16750 [Pseudanabaena biceps]|nr:hypothetical protein [Pseudanabaena biceps]
MGRVSPVWKLQRELEYAQKRNTYLSRTDRPVKQTVDKRVKTLVGYRSSLVKIAGANVLIELQASADAILKFGTISALGLIVAEGENLISAIKEPRAFKPAQVHGLVGVTTPTVGVAKGSGRRYIKYGAAAAGAAQASFTAPVSTGGSTATNETQRAKASEIAGAQKAAFNAIPGGYGRIWFTSEEYNVPLE